MKKFNNTIHKPNKLVLALALSWGIIPIANAQFSHPLELADLISFNGLNEGIIIQGSNAFNQSGRSVSSAGDINGDGIDDLIIGVQNSNPNGNFLAGTSYVVFGSDSGLPNLLNLANINGLNGFAIQGANTNDRSGGSVSSAGDINGDGMDDLIIGAYGFESNGNSAAGTSYVVFGSDSGFSNPFNLANINGLNGFAIQGVNAGDQSGRSVSSAGDINGDGMDDLIIGAIYSDPNGNSLAGTSYVVFGSDSGLPNPLNLANINGLNGFTIQGASANDRSGGSVSNAGDINGDGIDDLIVGAFASNSNTGTSYVVFGSDSGLPNPLNLANLNGLNGFAIQGVNVNDFSGLSVSSAGDINGDGIDDLIIGASRSNPNSNFDAGTSYVVFGSGSGFPNPLNLSNINGLNGFAIQGENANDLSGGSVSSAGDINGDGMDDLIIGAIYSDPNGNSKAGTSYVVFGSDSGLPNPLKLANLNGPNGFAINGINESDKSGSSVSSAGDFNGDGIDDLIVGARGAGYFDFINGGVTFVAEAGTSYVVFGKEKVIFGNGFEINN